MPIAVGAALLGIFAGAWLGFMFGIIVLISGDANIFMAINPVATIFIVLLKGVLAGLASGAAYRLFEKRNKTIAAISAAIACPVVNTGIFIIGCYAFFLPVLSEWGVESGAVSVTAFIFLVLISANFLFELGFNLILSPAIVRLIQYRYFK